jgi:hypothetical protein
MDICVLREYPQTENEFFRWRNSKRENRKAVFFTAWKPRRITVDDRSAGKAKGVSI